MEKLDLYLAHYENIILLRDYNVNISDSVRKLSVTYIYLEDPTCFKIPENPPCIDLILIINTYSFQNS